MGRNKAKQFQELMDSGTYMDTMAWKAIELTDSEVECVSDTDLPSPPLIDNL